MTDLGIDPFQIVPHWSVLDAASILAWFLVSSYLPGRALVYLAGCRLGCRAERWALSATLGTLWNSGCIFAAGLCGLRGWLLPWTVLPVLVGATVFAKRRLRCRSGRRWSRQPWAWSELAGFLLVATFAVGHVAQVSRGVEVDDSGVRFYGSWHTDKFINMSLAASMVEDIPPRCLRMAGQGFPYHFFPHVWIAEATRATAVNDFNVFWFHASAVGIVVAGLAVLAFTRRVLKSYLWGALALVLFGLSQFTTELRPLDLSVPLALLGFLAIDRWRAGGRTRWAVLAALLLAAIPLYEVFHACAVLSGLALWCLRDIIREARRGGPNMHLAGRQALFTAATLALAGGGIALTMVGVKPAGETKWLVKNSYYDSFKHEWANAIRDLGEEPSWIKTLYAWKRGRREFVSEGPASQAAYARAGFVRHAFAEIVFGLGLLVYVFLRFVNASLTGMVAIVQGRRNPSRPWPETWTLVALVGVVGFGVPCVVTCGHHAGGQWWESPNIYRPTTLAYLLLLLVGMGAVRTALTRWKRPMSWLLIACPVGQVAVLGVAFMSPAQSYHHVDFNQLAALSYIRQHVPRDEVVIHPWIHEAIHDSENPGQVAWVYRRHFTHGSNLTGRLMYYEGREENLFIGGFIDPDEVYRRSHLRERFYQQPDDTTVTQVLDNVQWVIADSRSPAPTAVREAWPVAYANATVTVYQSPTRIAARSLSGSSSAR